MQVGKGETKMTEDTIKIITRALSAYRDEGTHRECGVYGQYDMTCSRCKEVDKARLEWKKLTDARCKE